MAENSDNGINTDADQNQTTTQNTNTNSNKNHHDPSLPNSLYFIGVNESSGALLVTQILDANNYHSWARSIKRALRIKNKLGFIDGSLYAPADVENPLMEHWLRCNDIVISWLQNTMTVDIKASTLYVETAHQLWVEIEQRLAQQNAPRIYEIKQGIAALMQGHDTVSTYFSKLKTLLDELINYESIPNCTYGGLKTVVSNQERDWVMKFLMGLNESYKGLKAQILLIKPFPKLNEVYSLIQQEEKRREISNDALAAEGMALVSRMDMREVEKKNTGSPKKYYCTFCKMAGHSLERCFKANKDKSTCTHCKMPGHTISNCFKIHGYPPGHKFYNKPQVNFTSTDQNMPPMGSAQKRISDKNQVVLTQEEYTQLMALIKPSINQPHSPSANHVQGLNSLSLKHTNVSKISCTYTCSSAHIDDFTTMPWIVDTGATDHMVCSISFLTTIKEKISQPVTLPNGAIALATHIGNVKITENLLLHDDLTTWRTIGLSEVRKGLYHLVPKEVSPTMLDQNLPKLVNKAVLSVSADDS
ncbi:uncharacterized protein LOC111366948 [Olea europaea var. sylvestris]|uniref:uncharacterized protein LOC111366948 n=1 Tax=Olea europaea var. sylvestris TaxID=158386 RepID=UPI000C1D1742|nr:uncharacterized protein LOC111366948 [Olea europaea var. sylvestris]